MSKTVLLRARNVRSLGNPFRNTNNLQNGGWRVRNATNTGWIVMTAKNTLIRNPEHDPDVHAPDDPNFPLYINIVE